VRVESQDVIAALPVKRSEIQKAIAALQREKRKHKADMAQFDATIRLGNAQQLPLHPDGLGLMV
jgi:hypothetical protein